MFSRFQKGKAAALAVVVGIFSSLAYMPEAEARRFGGGSSFGRTAPSYTSKPAPIQKAAPTQQQSGTQSAATSTKPGATAGTAAAQPRRSFMGPLGGLAAGLGLAALFGYLGFGEGMASILGTMLMLGLGFFVIRALFRMLARNSSPQPAYGSAGAGQQSGQMYREPVRRESVEQAPAFPSGLGGAGSAFGNAGAEEIGNTDAPLKQTPAGFDEAAFLDNAKKFFVMIQAEFDKGNLDSLKEYCSDDVLAHAAQEIAQRGGADNHTSVVTLEAELLGFETDVDEQIATVAFTALLREERDSAAQEVHELWMLSRPSSGGGWVLAGIHNL